MYHKCIINVSQMYHICITNVSQMYHKCIKNASQIIKSITHVSPTVHNFPGHHDVTDLYYLSTPILKVFKVNKVSFNDFTTNHK